MKISLSDHFTYKKLIRAVLPSIIMIVFTSVYGIVNGIFVSNFAAVNLVMPIIMAIGCLGFYDKALLNMTANGMRVFCLGFIMMGINIFGSSFFTALNNGLISAIIAFVRTLVFQLIAVFTLPMIFSNPIDGIWFSVVVGEFASMLLTVIFFIAKRKTYNYA